MSSSWYVVEPGTPDATHRKSRAPRSTSTLEEQRGSNRPVNRSRRNHLARALPHGLTRDSARGGQPAPDAQGSAPLARRERPAQVVALQQVDPRGPEQHGPSPRPRPPQPRRPCRGRGTATTAVTTIFCADTVGRHAAQEAPVELDLADRHRPQVGQRRVPRPEVVQGDLDAAEPAAATARPSAWSTLFMILLSVISSSSADAGSPCARSAHVDDLDEVDVASASGARG